MVEPEAGREAVTEPEEEAENEPAGMEDERKLNWLRRWLSCRGELVAAPGDAIAPSVDVL